MLTCSPPDLADRLARAEAGLGTPDDARCLGNHVTLLGQAVKAARGPLGVGDLPPDLWPHLLGVQVEALRPPHRSTWRARLTGLLVVGLGLGLVALWRAVAP